MPKLISKNTRTKAGILKTAARKKKRKARLETDVRKKRCRLLT